MNNRIGKNVYTGFGVIISCLLFFSCKIKIIRRPKINIDTMQLVWSDEFDSDSTPQKPDSTKWTYETGGWGWGNQEKQFYTDKIKNAYISDGTLKIVAKKSKSGIWTSARLNSKFSFKYGYIESRMKLSPELGTWPAFWMLPQKPTAYGDWPCSGEIDIMEHCPNAGDWAGPGYVFSTVHYGNGYRQHKSTALGSTTIKTAVSKFHTYGLMWTKDKLTAYYDGKSIGESYSAQDKDWTEWPYNRNFYILLNLAMGGTLGGSIDGDYSKAFYEVDYVRVYQQKQQDENLP